jgi:glycosyltransferase involved in cell wall biosynthesis
MKLIIQIPCHNERDTLPQTVRDLPTAIDGIDTIEFLVIDDGSTDNTAQVARDLGVHHILINPSNQGLARSFARGLSHALDLGADIIVNTDGDNQYYGPDIAKLVQPILSGRAEIVVGDRQTGSISHFSLGKRLLQKFGSSVVRTFSGVRIPDAVSGFRAISRDAAMRINIVSTFSYTIEMLIQSGNKGLAVWSVPVRTNPKTRDSRLFKSIPTFIKRSGMTTLLMYAMFQPLRIFSFIGAIIAIIGAVPIVRFLYFYFFASGEGKIQSLIIGSSLLTVGAITFVMGLLADLVGRNRQLLEITLERVKRLEGALARAGLTALENHPIDKELGDGRNAQNQEDTELVVEPRTLREG